MSLKGYEDLLITISRLGKHTLFTKGASFALWENTGVQAVMSQWLIGLSLQRPQSQEVLLIVCPKSFLEQCKSISFCGEGKQLLIPLFMFTL